MSQRNGAGNGVFALLDVPATVQPSMAEDARVQYRPIFASFLVRFCVAVTLCVLLLAIGELAAYWRHLPDSGATLEPTLRRGLTNVSNTEREYWKQFEAADAVTYHPYVLWRRTPFQGSMININADGVRQTTHSACNDRNPTIWMFGDSTMWGAGAADDQTIASFLAADFQNAGQPVCIVNYGEKAWANTQEVVELIEQLKHTSHKPNLVVFYDGGTEAFTAYQTHQADMPSNYQGFKNYLEAWSAEQKPGFSYLEKTNTHRLLSGLSSKLAFRPKNPPRTISDDQVASLASAVVHNYQQNMEIIRMLGQQYGFRPLFVWYPTLVVTHKPLTGSEQKAKVKEEERFPGISRIYQAVYATSQEIQSPDFRYLGGVFDDEKKEVFVGISHIRPDSNRTIADRLFEIVEQAPLVNPAKKSEVARRKGHRRPA